jgi:hypothetical protein
MTAERFAWIVIYLNLPLCVAVGILAFVFGQWGVVKILLGANIVLLLASNLLLVKRNGRGGV